MRNLLLLLLFIFCLGISRSQQFLFGNYKCSPFYEVVDARNKQFFSRDGNVLALKYEEQNFVFQKFDQNGVPTKAVVTLNRNESLLNFIELPAKTIALVEVFDAKTSTRSIVSYELDFENNKFSNRQEIIRFNAEVLLNNFRKNSSLLSEKIAYKILVSPDQSKIVLHYIEEKKKEKYADNYGFILLDSNLSLLEHKQIKIPHNGYGLTPREYFFNSKGEVFLIATIYDGPKPVNIITSKSQESHNELVCINIADQSAKTVKNATGYDEIRSFKLIEDASKNTFLAGVYTKSSDNTFIGSGFAIMGLSDEALSVKGEYEIPQNIVTKYRKPKDPLKKGETPQKEAIANLEIIKIIQEQDGAMIIYAESSSEYLSTEDYQNNKGDVVVLKVKNDDIEWINKIPKRQVSASRVSGIGSYLTVHNGSGYVLFVDHLDNINLPENEVPREHKDGAGGHLACYKIDHSTGKMTKTHIFDLKNAGGNALAQFTMNRFVKLSDNELLIEAYGSFKKDITVKIKLD